MPIAKEEALRLTKKIEKEDRREGVINVELVALRVFEKDYMRDGARAIRARTRVQRLSNNSFSNSGKP